MKRPRKPRLGAEWIKHLFIAGIVGIELFPLYMTFQVSLKDNVMFLANPWIPAHPRDWVWDNWAGAWRLIAPALANSLFVSILTTGLMLVFAVSGAYFFARKKVPFARLLWPVFLLLIMLPAVVNIVPLFRLVASLDLLDTLWALILVGVAGGQAFNIFVLRNFLEDLPKDLFEAAEIDGASHWKQLWNVAIPLSLPILGTLSILTFISVWNDFLFPLVVLRDSELFTVGVTLIYQDGEYVRRWGPVMASYLLASLPLLVLFGFTMKWFVRGLSEGAVKG
jgi:multiple sugar transport system permease protein